MNKIALIIQREYLTRVKKKSFIIMTILGPLLMAGVFLITVFIAKNTDDSVSIQVINEAGIAFKNTEKVIYDKSQISFDDAKKKFAESDYYAILFVPKTVMTDASGVVLYSKKDVSMMVKERISSSIEAQIYNTRLASRGLDRNTLDSLKADVKIKTIKATESGEESGSSEAATVIGLFSGFLIYFFIFLYGIQVMRGVMEEKTNRIVEVIISSVKPFQLMMGKIVGVALVGLTQFVLWVALTFGITTLIATTVLGNASKKEKMQYMTHQTQVVTTDEDGGKQFTDADKDELFGMVKNVNFPLIISMFVFYFLGGYLIYSALFAAVGSAIDSESDTQQFMLPITIPLILSFIVAQSVVTTNPDSPIAFWFSIIPFTSPIVMMVRIPFGVPAWELALSMGALIGGFIFTTWLAGRIYRTGILMYGKKVNYRELAKWLFYKG